METALGCSASDSGSQSFLLLGDCVPATMTAALQQEDLISVFFVCRYFLVKKTSSRGCAFRWKETLDLVGVCTLLE